MKNALLVVFGVWLLICAPSVPGWCNTYLIGPGDVLKVSVYDHPDLDSVVRVTEDGTVVLPLLGKFSVAKQTIPQVTESITAAYADGYIINPQVNVFVQEYRSKKVVVLGHVKKPGLIELSGPTTLLELISTAGGLDQEAGETASIKRKVDGEDKVIVVDLKSLIEGGDLTHNLRVFENDTVYISKAGMCFITGQVKQPGTYICGTDATVLKLVALASGFTGKANKSGVSIVRIIDGEKVIKEDVALDTPLVTGDVVVVPESFF